MTQNKNPKDAAIDILFSCKSTEEVAQLMKKCNIKGQPRCSSSCPISKYMKKATNKKWTALNTCMVNEDGVIYNTTSVIENFIKYFDIGFFPNLIEYT